MQHRKDEVADVRRGGKPDTLSGGRLPAIAVLSGGGFSFETKRLLQSLEQQLTFHFLVTEYGGVPGTDGIPAGTRVPVPSFASVTSRSLSRSLRAFVGTFMAAHRLLSRERDAVALVVGSSHAVPVFLAARLARRPTVFVETITRSDRLSATGWLVYRLHLADRFIVQWPRLQRMHPRSVLGTVL